MRTDTIELIEPIEPKVRLKIPKLIKISLALLTGYFTVQVALTGYSWGLQKIETAKHNFVQHLIASELSGPIIVELDKKGQLVVQNGADMNLAETRKALVYYKLKSESLHSGIGQIAEVLAMTMDADNDER